MNSSRASALVALCLAGPTLAQSVVVETFANAGKLDPQLRAGRWANGNLTFDTIGGDGRHGEFVATSGTYLGVVQGKDTYEFDTGNLAIPAEQSLTGVATVVTDGRLSFTRFHVPANVRVVFRGMAPLHISCMGPIDIQGELDASGQSLTTLPSNTIVAGQLGGRGGAGGGQGGQGGDKCNGLGVQPNHFGRDGQSVQVLPGHPYSGSAQATRGRGSELFPSDGLSSSLIFGGTTVAYTPSAAAGGGGGGNFTAGLGGLVVSNNHIDPILLVAPRRDAMGPPSPASSAYPFFPLLPFGGQNTVRSSEHFLVGGAGGGGAGSHGCLSIAITTARNWAPGGGGGGGGGAVALRTGTDLVIAANGAVLANGGRAASQTGVTASSSPAPGGGGAGGAIVLQAERTAAILGSLDVRGGAGGVYNRMANGSPNIVPFSAAVHIEGGQGGDGVIRFEMPTAPSAGSLAGAQPAATAQNVGPLVEVDVRTASRSDFYWTGSAGNVAWGAYEIRATVDGVPTVFSDDPNLQVLPAGTGQPVEIYLQAAEFDPSTTIVQNLRPWRAQVRPGGGSAGMSGDGGNAFRFHVVADRTLASTIVVHSVRVGFLPLGTTRGDYTAAPVAVTLPTGGLADHRIAPTASGELLLFGGTTDGGMQPFTYLFDGASWNKQFPAFAPVPRTAFDLAFDAARGATVLFGGRLPTGAALGDTWQWQNGGWQLAATSGPAARYGHGLAKAPGNRGVALYGGRDLLGALLGDLWTWDGQTWTAQAVNGVPALAEHAMAFDANRQRLVVFGGNTSSGPSSEVHEWDGQTWSNPQALYAVPAPRQQAAFAYDPRLATCVLFGGLDQNGFRDDAWQWDGQDWQPHDPAGQAPAARAMAGMAFDAASQRLQLLGGRDQTGRLGDQWELTLPSTARTSAYGSGCAGSLGVPTWRAAPGSRPVLGQSFVAELGNLPPSPFVPCFVFVDLQRDTFAGLAIPAPLAAVGLPGCSAWAGNLFVQQLPAPLAGVTTWTVALPNSLSLIGTRLFSQGLVYDPTPGRWGAVSPGLEARLGNF